MFSVVLSVIAAGGPLPVKVLFDGEPMSDLRVSSGCETRGGGLITHALTDVDGQARVELTAPGRWFIRAHYIRPHQDAPAADWESFWASLTFHVDG